jgi:hypothetical protein
MPTLDVILNIEDVDQLHNKLEYLDDEIIAVAYDVSELEHDASKLDERTSTIEDKLAELETIGETRTHTYHLTQSLKRYIDRRVEEIVEEKMKTFKRQMLSRRDVDEEMLAMYTAGGAGEMREMMGGMS